MRHDTLNDALATIKNAEASGETSCTVRPASKLIGRVLNVMQESRYVRGFEFKEDGRGGYFEVRLRGNVNDCGVIRPRFSVKRTDLERYESRYLPAQDFGVLILTTTRGVLSHSQAKEEGVGGRLLAYVY
ncbi:MAG: 30S ribosomal protein S8 [Candidatus Thermoplasmatota archaeon]|nr:30S ribosomal protein S8 [Candidatus Thermoplasmatota archaeon]